MKTRLFYFLACSLLIGFSSCVEDELEQTIKNYTDEEYAVLEQVLNIPQDANEYKLLDLPPQFRGSTVGTGLTNGGATLGRVLFYDKQLSKNNKVSCASCHLQEKAFADPVAFSEGFQGELTERNSLALGNVRFYYDNRGFFWDERAHSIQEQTKETIENHIEMGLDLQEMENKLAGQEHYEILFRRAFGSPEITEDNVAEALAQFVRSMVSFRSSFDKALGNELDRNNFNGNGDFSMFSPEENRGKTLFMENCSSCHGNRLFPPVSIANNGLDATYTDKGVGEITGRISDAGVFKVPLLRNIALTGPYMHDGRFETLEEVVEHYNSGVENHPNLHFSLKENFSSNGVAKKLNLTEEDKAALVAFLHTLTDEAYATDEIYANPFK